MKQIMQILFSTVFAISLVTVAGEDQDRPGSALEKVMKLLVDLQNKIDGETERQIKMNRKKTRYCEDTNYTARRDLEAAKEEYADAISKRDAEKAILDELEGKINMSTSMLAQREEEYQSAQEQREVEEGDFQYNLKTLEDAKDALGRAKVIIDKEMKRNPAELAQVDTNKLRSLLQTVSTITDAMSLPSYNKDKLLSLIQSQDGDADLVYHSHSVHEEPAEPDETLFEGKLTQPEIKAYHTQSGSIYEMIEMMLEKTETEYRERQDAEKVAKHNFGVAEIGFKADIEKYKKELTEDKATKEEHLERYNVAFKDALQAGADIAHTDNLVKELAEDCMTWKINHVVFMDGQKAEMQALGDAEEAVHDAMGHVKKGVIEEAVKTTIELAPKDENAALLETAIISPDDPILGGAASASQPVQQAELVGGCKATKYGCCSDGLMASNQDGSNCPGSLSLLQSESDSSNSAVQVQRRVVDFVRRLGRRHHSTAITQLASKMKTMMMFQSGDDFSKVKQMIRDMIQKLEDKLEEARDEEAYCRIQMNETNLTLQGMGVDIHKLNDEIEMSYARELSIEDKRKRAEAQKAALAKANQELNEFYAKQTQAHVLTKAELEDGLAAVQKAIDILKKFYGEVTTALVQQHHHSYNPESALQPAFAPTFLQEHAQVPRHAAQDAMKDCSATNCSGIDPDHVNQTCPDNTPRRQFGNECCACDWKCANEMCATDLCPDNTSRRQIGDKCCSCDVLQPTVDECEMVQCDACPEGFERIEDGSCCGACKSISQVNPNFKKKTQTGQFIIGMLEIVEGDLARGLSKEEAEYSGTSKHYQKEERGFSVNFEEKGKDIIYYGSEYLSQDRYTGQVNDTITNKMRQQREVIKTWIILKDRCEAKPGLYGEKKLKREQEIAGLKEALRILNEEAALLEVKHRSRRGLRGLTLRPIDS